MKSVVVTGCLLALGLTPTPAPAQPGPSCQGIPTHAALRAALVAAQAEANGGLGFHMWGSIVDRRSINNTRVGLDGSQTFAVGGKQLSRADA